MAPKWHQVEPKLPPSAPKLAANAPVWVQIGGKCAHMGVEKNGVTPKLAANAPVWVQIGGKCAQMGVEKNEVVCTHSQTYNIYRLKYPPTRRILGGWGGQESL